MGPHHAGLWGTEAVNILPREPWTTPCTESYSGVTGSTAMQAAAHLLFWAMWALALQDWE